MAEKHPDELELLSFVEEELDADSRQELAQHFAACRACAEQVRRLEAGKAALQTAPLLDLPEDRHETIIASLPERSDRRRLFRPAKRALVIAAPVAAAAALVGIFAFTGPRLGGGDDEAGREAAQAEEPSRDASGGGAEAGQEPQVTGPQLLTDARFVRSVGGPPAKVVHALETQGIAARVDKSGAVLATGPAAAVREALAGRPGGDVDVYSDRH
jgi:hypothetical protein